MGGDVRAPLLLERVEPDYPEAARRARLEGTVILEATITASGEVQQVRVVKALNPLLDEAAVRAVRGWPCRVRLADGDRPLRHRALIGPREKRHLGDPRGTASPGGLRVYGNSCVWMMND